MEQSPSNLGVAAVLSFFIPGLGQIYKGQLGEGFFWMVATAFGYLFFVFPGVVLHIMCIANAAGKFPKPKNAHA